LIVGEIVNYPDQWLQFIDAVMNFSLRHIVLDRIAGAITPVRAGHMVDRLISDAGIEPMQNRVLRIGNFRLVDSERLSAFERYTNRALEATARN
jgi:hypothetical protein